MALTVTSTSLETILMRTLCDDPVRRLGALRTLYNEVIAQQWFDATTTKRVQFARYLCEQFASAPLDDEQTRATIFSVARMAFSAVETPTR